MFRRLMTATGLAVVLTAPAFAQSQDPNYTGSIGTNILQFGVGTFQGATGFSSNGYWGDPNNFGAQSAYMENYGSAIQSIVDQGQQYQLNTMAGVGTAPGILIAPSVDPSATGTGSDASVWSWGVGQVAGFDLGYGSGSNNNFYGPDDIFSFVSQFGSAGNFTSFGPGPGFFGPEFVQAAINTNFAANRDTPLMSTVIVGGNQSAVNIVNSASLSLADTGGNGFIGQQAVGQSLAINIQQAIAYNGEAFAGTVAPTVQQAAVQINSASINLEGDASAIQTITLSRNADISAFVGNFATASSLANSLPTIDPTVRNIAQTAQFSLNQLSFSGAGTVNLKMGDGNAYNGSPYNSSVNVRMGNAASAFTGALVYRSDLVGTEPDVYDTYYLLQPGVGAATVSGVQQLATFSFDAIRAGKDSTVNLNLGTDQFGYYQTVDPSSYTIRGLNSTGYAYPTDITTSAPQNGPGSFVVGSNGYEASPFDAVFWDRGFQTFFAGNDSTTHSTMLNFITAQTGLGNAAVSGVANSYKIDPNNADYKPYFTQAFLVESNTIAAGGTVSGFLNQGIYAVGLGSCYDTYCQGSYTNLALAVTETGSATMSNVSQYASQQYNALSAGNGLVATTTSADQLPIASQINQVAAESFLYNSNVQAVYSNNGGAAISGAYQQSLISLNSVNAPSIAGTTLSQAAVGVGTYTYNTLSVNSNFNGSISGTQISQSSINSIVSPARPAVVGPN